MPPLKAQLLLEESLSAYFPEMVFTDSGITVQLHRNTHRSLINRVSLIFWIDVDAISNWFHEVISMLTTT